MACDVLLDEAVSFDVDGAGAVGELRDQFLGHAGDLQSPCAVLASLASVPLDTERAGQGVGEYGVVVLGDCDHATVDRNAVEAAPLPVVGGPDLIGDDDVGVELRITGPGVPVIVRSGCYPEDLVLSHSTVSGVATRPGQRDFTFEERNDLCHRLVVS